MHQWHRVVARPGAYGADISTRSCHDPVLMLALDIGTGANDHPVPQAGFPLLDISKSLTTPHSYLYPSHFSTSHLSLPYPLSLKKPGVDRIPSGGAPLPRSARSCRACGQLAAGRCRRQALPWCAGCHRRRRARGLRLPPCRRSWSSAPPVVLACFPHAAVVFLACLLGVRHRRLFFLLACFPHATVVLACFPLRGKINWFNL